MRTHLLAAAILSTVLATTALPAAEAYPNCHWAPTGDDDLDTTYEVACYAIILPVYKAAWCIAFGERC